MQNRKIRTSKYCPVMLGIANKTIKGIERIIVIKIFHLFGLRNSLILSRYVCIIKLSSPLFKYFGVPNGKIANNRLNLTGSLVRIYINFIKVCNTYIVFIIFQIDVAEIINF